LRGIHSDLHNVGQEINQLLGFQVIDIFKIMMMVVICDGYAHDHYFDENWKNDIVNDYIIMIIILIVNHIDNDHRSWSTLSPAW
jgi:hypothetical protein